ncbi:hypothetical protein PsorP6_007318 [Peronosclerospora sorghi]|uniref:Uncharacterized protein n=1 Tax=Peronosclerospora sorghi TaxID=230839 RepID=A0ACC0WCE6_9STRA|nr:hypothetical protein PsorP6_007318 [Peronosclerospora sorghi]
MMKLLVLDSSPTLETQAKKLKEISGYSSVTFDQFLAKLKETNYLINVANEKWGGYNNFRNALSELQNLDPDQQKIISSDMYEQRRWHDEAKESTSLSIPLLQWQKGIGTSDCFRFKRRFL